MPGSVWSPFLADDAFGGFDDRAHPRDPSGRFRRVKFLGGTTGAWLVAEKTGKRRQFVAKGGNSDAQIRSEFSANRLYAKAGVRVPKTEFVDGEQIATHVGEKHYARPLGDYLRRTASGWEPKDETDVEWLTARDELREGFAVDAWLANWDVLGLDMDNVLVTANRYVGPEEDLDVEAYRVDNGGALSFRAMGAPKGDKWGPEASEIERLRKPGRSAEVVFGGLSDRDVASQIEKLDEAALLGEVDRLRAAEFLSAEDARILRERLAFLKGWAGNVDRGPVPSPVMESAFLGPLVEITGRASFGGFDPNEHPRDIEGRFRKKAEALGVGQMIRFPGGGFIKKKADGFDFINREGARKSTPHASWAVRSSLDRSARSTEADSPGGGSRYPTFEAAMKGKGGSASSKTEQGEKKASTGSVTLDDGKTRTGDTVEITGGTYAGRRAKLVGITGSASGGYSYKAKLDGGGMVELDRKNVRKAGGGGGTSKAKPEGPAGGEGSWEKPKLRGKLTDPLGQEVVVDGKKIGRLRKGRASVDPAYRGKARGSTQWYIEGKTPGGTRFRQGWSTKGRALEELAKLMRPKTEEGEIRVALFETFLAPLDEAIGLPSFDEKKHPRGGKGSAAGGKFVKKGSSGQAVRAVQRKVGEKTDGVFGKFTAAGVRNFQRENGLQVDGVVGRQTAAALLGSNTKRRVGAITERQMVRLTNRGKKVKRRLDDDA